jgi:hypothetical protein
MPGSIPVRNSLLGKIWTKKWTRTKKRSPKSIPKRIITRFVETKTMFMKNLILTLMAVLILSMPACVSVNPATGNYPVTGDVLEAWISGIPYEFVDERQYFRSANEKNVNVPGVWIDKDKKGNWFVLYNIEGSSETSFSPASPPTPTAKFAPWSEIRYVERPFRR